VSTHVHAFSASAEVVALRRTNEMMVLIGNVGTQTSVVPVNLQEILDPNTEYDLRIYNSERQAWGTGARRRGRSLHSLAVPIESAGFRAIELKKAQT
jgi:hypothetical protein